MQLSSDIVEVFFKIYDGPADRHILPVLTISQCRVYVSQMTIEACKPLFIYKVHFWRN